MFHLRRKEPDPPAPTPKEGEETRFAEMVEAFAAVGLTGDLPDGRFGRALAKLVRPVEMHLLDDAALVSTLSAEASETAVNVGWVSHDVHEMTRSGQAISAAVEELAASINAVAENSVDSAQVADRTRHTMENCVTDSRAATNAMSAIDRRVG